MGKQVCFQVTNAIVYILSIVLMHVVYTNAFVQAHKGAFAVFGILLLVAYLFSSSYFLKEQFLQGVIGLFYLVIMDFFLFSQYWVEEPLVNDLWVIMLSSIFLCSVTELCVWAVFKPSEIASSDETAQSENTVISIPSTRFDHIDFDGVLEQFETDIVFLQQHEPIIGVEAVHQVEQVLRDFYKMCGHYHQIRAERRSDAERLIETLCRHAEIVTEEYKAQIDMYYLAQLEKLTTKHVR